MKLHKRQYKYRLMSSSYSKRSNCYQTSFYISKNIISCFILSSFSTVSPKLVRNLNLPISFVFSLRRISMIWISRCLSCGYFLFISNQLFSILFLKFLSISSWNTSKNCLQDLLMFKILTFFYLSFNSSVQYLSSSSY